MKYEFAKSIDMICQHSSDGTIIPIKMRMEDDDGEFQEYKIKSYKPGEATNHIFPFDCTVENFGREVRIQLFYSAYEHKWYMKRQ